MKNDTPLKTPPNFTTPSKTVEKHLISEDARSEKNEIQSEVWHRLQVGMGLLLGLRYHDFRAARTFVNTKYLGQPLAVRWWRFVRWSFQQMFYVIPDAMQHVTLANPISKTPMWLIDGNPFANYPWKDNPSLALPEEVDTVTIGAGFTGGGLAYHWSKKAPHRHRMVVLEMDDPASGSSGRNEGLVVMGRYYAMVHGTVLKHLNQARRDLGEQQRDQLAKQFSAAYCKAAYKNADMIEQTVKTEKFECDYAREGWVQAQDADQQKNLEEAVRMASESHFTDWTKITPNEVLKKSGMKVRHNAGFSIAAASFHPAKWVWSLFRVALNQPTVLFFTRTKVLQVEDVGEHYLVHTSRGIIRTRHVVNATESYTPLLHSRFHNLVWPIQTQAACGDGGPTAIKPHVGISGSWFFCGRHGSKVMTGSDSTRVPDGEAGRNQPSRFLTKFLLGEMKKYFGPYRYHITNEWSGTVGFTPDEYPVVGKIDGKRQYMIGGMCGSGTGVSFNASRCIVNRILGITAASDDYPESYFAPSRLLDPMKHPWPEIEE